MPQENKLTSNNFDILRLIFASMVVFFHISILSQAPELAWMEKYISSTFAVQAFFVVSGFLVTMSYENSSSIRSYAIKRIRRIFPAYIVVVVGAAFLCAFASTLPAREYFSDLNFWRYLGYNLTLSNFAAPSLPGVFEKNHEISVNASLWTIKIEVAFYIFVPFMVLAIRRFGALPTLATIFVASIVWKTGFNYLGETQNSELLLKLAKQLPGQLSFFCGGAWAYYQTRDEKFLSWQWPLVGVIAYFVSEGYVYQILAPAAVTLIVQWAATSAPKSPRIGKHGDFSYGIYLYHFPIVQLFVAAGLLTSFPWASAVACCVITVILSILSWHFIEKPSLAKAHSPELKKHELG